MKKSFPLFAASLLTLAVAGHATAEDKRYIVTFKHGKSESVNSFMNKRGGRRALEIRRHNAMAAHLSAEALKEMRSNPDIAFIEEDVKRYPMSQDIPYGIPMVQADQLGDSQAGNRTICIIDSGYDIVHEDLSGNAVTGSSDPDGAGNWYEDQSGHGTHVAGTIAAMNNDTGVAGIMPSSNINLHIVKVFGGDGWAYSSSLMEAAEVCAENGANVINMSLGGESPNAFERRAFSSLNRRGILSIAAAGNDGNTAHSYPASYSSVLSVGAIDSSKEIWSSSQQTNQVELSAPGVQVLSSVPTNTGRISSLTLNGTEVEAAPISGTPAGEITGYLEDCGTAESACISAAGKLCLIERGNISFAEKVLNCESGGGVGAIVYNNEDGLLSSATLGDTATNIPSVGISDIDGAALLLQLSANVHLVNEATSYEYFNGTSMATPHVAGVTALVWSHFPNCSNTEIRNALTATAEDLGDAGRDNAYGYGLVQAKAAYDYLSLNGCSGLI
ncbi:S8 family serine peptidase [Microbulbifer sp. OS29]|uniref:S8 family serine peptidase n=1 Tax=Microbulbifer okhotskensis TaxID=2926617 RepID=A0A9X2J4Q4_9GAMM|nr:S8 family serine peptidase [Microbulbifer okhotskensis]MCO1332790.1 S8 family serine peptidase [Microbulbifer okhotskensis]